MRSTLECRLLRVALALTLALLALPAVAGTGLGFEELVECRRAIEQVYWRHRVWPADNPAPKPALAAVLPEGVLRARVERTQALSRALADFWRRPVAPGQLQAELDRMGRQTRNPELLRELFAAVGGDPYRAAECIARPLLVERLARACFSADERIHGARILEDWLLDVVPEGGEEQTAEPFAYRIPHIGGVAARPALPVSDHGRLPDSGKAIAGADAWTPTAALPEGWVNNTAVWTGSEMIVWGGENYGKFGSGSRYDPATDSWTTTASLGAPLPRGRHTAVWTGSEMIVWGGCGQLSNYCETNSGGRYDPTTDTWTATGGGPNAPGARRNHTAVWTGDEMIVWGGCVTGSMGNNQCEVELADGARYRPSTDTWAAVATAGEPAARVGHTAVWTGSEMIVWGGHPGSGVTSTGGRYNPATNTWAPVTGVGAPSARALHAAVAANGKMIVWGGCDNIVCASGNTPTNSGGIYDPGTNTWSATTTLSAPDARRGHTAVWTGSEMIVWGGQGADFGFRDTGGRYDPLSDNWTDTTTVNAPPARAGHRAVWTGSEMIIWGVLVSGGRYAPASNTWVPTNTSDPGEARVDNPVVWTGSEMIVWGGDDRLGSFEGTGDRYDPATANWSPTSLAGAPGPRERWATAVWTGTEMIVWGGQIGTELLNTGGRYNPTTDTWQATSMAHAPAPRADHAAVWTGTKMIVWGGSSIGAAFETNTGGRYDPVANSWQATTTTGAPPAARFVTGVWTGQHMVVWGGYGNFTDLKTGGRYDPVTNAWLPTATTGAPAARHYQSAHWTGSKLLVWGGMSGNLDSPNYMNDGALYDPAANAWAPIASSGAPGPRIWHGSVWTGSELIVWGGCTGSTSCPNGTNTGSRYDLATDTWTATTLQSVPSARSKVSAVWTGSDMIVWGGAEKSSGTYTTTGGLYRPVVALLPREVSPPGSTEPLVFLDAVTLSWESAVSNGADTFNLYCGDMATMNGGAYGTCLQSGLGANSTTDARTPGVGAGWYYLVTGVNAAGEGPMGHASSGDPQTPAGYCP